MLFKIVDNVDQGTPAWHDQRRLRVTGSRVAAVLGCSPWQSADNLMREMLLESAGIRNEASSPAMDWGTTHEEIARAEIELEHGLDFTDQLMRVTDDMGYSPDGFDARANVLLEIKCPYSLRDSESPGFLSIEELPHYMAQIQMGMLATGADTCLFSQWTPYGRKDEFVKRSPQWWQYNQPKVDAFILELKARASDAGYMQGLVEATNERTDAAWAKAGKEYAEAKKALEAAKKVLDGARQTLIDLAPEGGFGCGVRLTQVISQGRVNTKALYGAYNINDETLEEFRGKSTTNYRVTEVKP